MFSIIPPSVFNTRHYVQIFPRQRVISCSAFVLTLNNLLLFKLVRVVVRCLSPLCVGGVLL